MTTFTYEPADTDDLTEHLTDWLNDPAHDGTEGSPNILQLPVYSLLRHKYQITVTQRKEQSLHMQGARLLDMTSYGARGDRHLAFRGCENYEIKSGLIVSNADPAMGYQALYEAQHGIDIGGCKNFKAYNMRIFDVWGDKIYIGPFEGQWSDGVTVELLQGSYSHRHGLAITAGKNITVKNCNFGKCGRSGIDIEGNSVNDGCDTLSVENCRWTEHRLNWIACAAAGGTYDNLSFTDCISESKVTVQFGQKWFENHGRRSNISIKDCTGFDPAGNPMGALMNFYWCEGDIEVSGIINDLSPGRTPPMRIARFDEYTTENADIVY